MEKVTVLTSGVSNDTDVNGSRLEGLDRQMDTITRWPRHAIVRWVNVARDSENWKRSSSTIGEVDVERIIYRLIRDPLGQ